MHMQVKMHIFCEKGSCKSNLTSIADLGSCAFLTSTVDPLNPEQCVKVIAFPDSMDPDPSDLHHFG